MKKSTVALVASLAFVFLTAEDCGPSTSSSAGISFCVVKPDWPHSSGHASGKINAIGWFNCKRFLQDATLSIRLERLEVPDWRTVDSDSESFEPVTAGVKKEVNVAIDCVPGVFRTSVQFTVHTADGAYSKSAWFHSIQRRLDC